MRWVIQNHLLDPGGGKVLDVGSRDVNGSYRELFKSWRYDYTGIDTENGPNVDVVAENPYRFPFPSEHFDFVVSGQTIEHVPAFWKWAEELKRVLKIGGKLVIIGPWKFGVHRFPVDCWRVLPDGMRSLLGDHLGMKILYADFGPEKGEEDCDVVGVAVKEE